MLSPRLARYSDLVDALVEELLLADEPEVEASETTMPERSGQGPVGHLMESSVEDKPDHPASASTATLPGV